jgi:hypothetical protein
MAKQVQATKKIDLPKGVKDEDLEYPSFKSKRRVVETLKLHYTERFGWCVATLSIRRATGRRAGTQDRTYAYTLDGKVVRVGLGPHVLRTVDVYVTEKALGRLQYLLDLAQQGEAKAGDIRDRISSRRAQGALRRSTWF